MAQQNPLLPSVPKVQDIALQDYLNQMHLVVAALHTSSQPPSLPSSLTVTPIALGNVIQFTRSNGITYNLYIGTTPDRSKATLVSLGSANKFTDNVGSGLATRYYWVEALNQGGLSSGVIGPKSGSTLNSGAVAQVPAVRPAQQVVFDTTTNTVRPVIASTDPDISPIQQPRS